MNQKTAVIIGAGPAGLTAALEFLRRSDIRPIVLEASHAIGGLSRTVEYKGNRMDIGGHRFFSKNDWVMNWWAQLMPPQSGGVTIQYQNQERDLPEVGRAATADPDLVMLVRQRKSRIYFLRRFFDYPVTLTWNTLRGLGFVRTVKVGFSYVIIKFNQRRPEKSLEDFLINRFGKQLYLTFFKSYTEKVWGVSCGDISAEWGAQRIKGLSLTTAVLHIIKKMLRRKPKTIAQKDTETSLIEQFLYPKFGPGQLWEHVASLVERKGGAVLLGWRVGRIFTEGERVIGVEAATEDGEIQRFNCHYLVSTMPVRELIHSLDAEVPASVVEVSDGLMYRDFITVGLLVKRLVVTEDDGKPLKDTWIYIQEPDVLLGRLQIFNNWSPHMVANPETMWIGLEYFCYETDDLWKMTDEQILNFAAGEVEQIGIAHRDDVLDGHVLRVPKTYPAYFGTYERFDEIRSYLDRYSNLFLVGRNGMHKYNNQDHSMLTAKAAVDCILDGDLSKQKIWDINTEQEYHEKKS